MIITSSITETLEIMYAYISNYGKRRQFKRVGWSLGQEFMRKHQGGHSARSIFGHWIPRNDETNPD